MSYLAVTFAGLIAATWWFSDEQANRLLQVSAIGSVIGALTSLGSNGFLSKRLVGMDESHASSVAVALFLSRAVAALLLVFGVALSGLWGAFDPWWTTGLLVCALSAQVTTIEFHSERSADELVRFARGRLLAVALLLPAKIAAILGGSPEYFGCVFLADGLLAALIYLAKRKQSIRTVSNGVEAAIDVAKGSWLIWLSSVIQIGWTRVFFVAISESVGYADSNMFFLVVRLIEALVFLPNSASSVHNQAIVREYAARGAIGAAFDAYQRDHVRMSLFATMLVAGACVAQFFRNGDGDLLVFVLATSAAILFYVRASLSRFIVLNEMLTFSPLSYLVGVLLSVVAWLVGGQGAKGLYVFYFMQQFGSVAAVAFAWRGFKPYFVSLFRMRLFA